MQLFEWQEALQRSILTNTHSQEKTLGRWVKANSVSIEKRLGIYIDAYILRLNEALRVNYPTIHQLLGDEGFDVMARGYLALYPPAHATIRWYGEYLSRFLKNEPPYDSLAVLAELADFEWALRHTIDAADVDVLTFEDLHGVNKESWAELRFSLHPSLTVLNLNWNTPQIWHELTEGVSPPDPLCNPMHWMVYRQPDLVSGWRSASTTEITALRSVGAGLTFADMCEEISLLIEAVEDVPLTAASFLRSWAEQGLLSLRVG